jgi:hypothetical protein
LIESHTHLLARGNPFSHQNATVSIITVVTRDEPKPVRELVKGVPPELEHIVLRCLRKAREERYASASEVERQLEDFHALTFASAGGMNLRMIGIDATTLEMRRWGAGGKNLTANLR